MRSAGATEKARCSSRRFQPRKPFPSSFWKAFCSISKAAGVLESKKGKGGGYQLSRPPSTITIGSIIRLLEGPLAPLPCASETAFKACEECQDIEHCGTRMIMRQVRDAIADGARQDHAGRFDPPSGSGQAGAQPAAADVSHLERPAMLPGSGHTVPRERPQDFPTRSKIRRNSRRCGTPADTSRRTRCGSIVRQCGSTR